MKENVINRKLKLEELNRPDLETYKEAEKLELVVVLDNIRSLNNIGSVFRTADAFLVQEVVLCGITACPPHKDIHKTALGATDSVKWTYFKSTAEAIEALRNREYQIISLEQTENSILLDEFDVDQKRKYALVFGHEVKGIDQEVVDMSDYTLEIPQYGTKHSLNISVCAGIAIYNFFLKLHSKI